MQGVIYSNFNELRRKKAMQEDRDISLRTVAKETGLAFTTLSRVSKRHQDIQSVRLSTINALCVYFGVANVSELIEFRQEGDDLKIA